MSEMRDAEGASAHSQELARRRRQRNLALAIVLAGLAALFFATTIVRIGQSSQQRGGAPITINNDAK